MDMIALAPGKEFIWREKRLLTFVTKDARFFYFTCPDFASVECPRGIVSLSKSGLKELEAIKWNS